MDVVHSTEKNSLYKTLKSEMRKRCLKRKEKKDELRHFFGIKHEEIFRIILVGKFVPGFYLDVDLSTKVYLMI